MVKVGGSLVKVGGSLVKVGGSLVKVGGSLMRFSRSHRSQKSLCFFQKFRKFKKSSEPKTSTIYQAPPKKKIHQTQA